MEEKSEGPICIFNNDGKEYDCASKGTRFKQGTTKVAYRAFDKAGNETRVEFPIVVAVRVQAGFTVSPDALAIVEGGTGTYTVVLTAQPAAGNVVIDVSVSASDTGEATVFPASLEFTTDNWNKRQTVTVTAVNDDGVAADHSAIITNSINHDLTDWPAPQSGTSL